MLSDAASRQHYLERPRRDWDAFFEACGDDPVIEEIKVLLDLLDPSCGSCSSPPGRSGSTTSPRRGCAATRSAGTCSSCGPWGDYDFARDFKQASVWDLRRYGFELALAIEDDRRNVEMFRSEGVPCIYFHSGYYD